jgi:hypothetical protein
MMAIEQVAQLRQVTPLNRFHQGFIGHRHCNEYRAGRRRLRKPARAAGFCQAAAEAPRESRSWPWLDGCRPGDTMVSI